MGFTNSVLESVDWSLHWAEPYHAQWLAFALFIEYGLPLDDSVFGRVLTAV